MVDPQLVSDSLVFSRKKTENAKMAAVVSDVFWHLVEGLREIDNAAVSVPPVDERIDNAVLVAFQTRSSKTAIFWLSTGSSSSGIISSPSASMTS